MSTKDLVKNYLDSDQVKLVVESPESLFSTIISKMSFKELLSLRNTILDDNFKQLMKDSDMVNCIEEFFKYNLNVAETSRNSYLHRNTLLYRIDKIYHLTGYNLKIFEDAVSFKILMKIYELTS